MDARLAAAHCLPALERLPAAALPPTLKVVQQRPGKVALQVTGTAGEEEGPLRQLWLQTLRNATKGQPKQGVRSVQQEQAQKHTAAALTAVHTAGSSR